MDIKISSVLSRLSGLLVLLVGVTFLSFSLIYLAPGDPAEALLRAGGSMPSREAVESKREEMGLNRPFLVQYGSWLSDCAKGDLGKSMIDGKDVTRQLLAALKSSMALSVLSLVCGVAVALPVGVYASVRKNSMFDRIACFIIFFRMSMPAFMVGLGFLYLFAYRMRLVPISSSMAGAAGIILPVMTLATGICAKMIRQVRSIISDELNAFYVDGLRSRGIKEERILFAHVLKNAMLPIITLVALSFGELLGGTAITETIFSFPGIEKLVMEAIHLRDYTIVQGFVVVVAVIFFLVYGFTELSYGLFDPRVRAGKTGGKLRGHMKGRAG